MNFENQAENQADQNSDVSLMLEQSRDILYGSQNGLDGFLDGDKEKSESRSFSQPYMNINSTHDQSRDLSSNGMPQWAVGMCKQLDTIEKQLSSQLQTQNQRWSKIESQLVNQNTRMTNIESQIAQIGAIQQAVTENDRNLQYLKTDYPRQKNRSRNMIRACNIIVRFVMI